MVLTRVELHILRLKNRQWRGDLPELQHKYEDDKLTLANSAICAAVRSALISLLWANFLGRGSVDRKLFRKLVQIESGFTYLLITRRSKKGNS